jgi:hypothetical protein
MTKPIDIDAIARAERKRINWNRVHLEGDRRAPLVMGDVRTGRYSGSTSAIWRR